ncbi:hypothetical protein Q4489_07285 [Thalassotalea sp. 1_MG-2023]|uniref:hypothetical protein n=1 Tax=Thalassotalea sp. 1_MG-2023 TaxID=3062680 RepID=UPI0026E2F21F|nr:hypothetical protein [Thalassotalea sp. 1_MG-2023]MDO6426810.1 hypothetical protein [Thalassotalea sp. 1_MG-2023]
MKTINIFTAALLLVAGNATATNIAFEKAQPVNTVEITSQAHEDVKISMQTLVTAFETNLVKPITVIKTAKKATKSELIAKNEVIAE